MTKEGKFGLQEAIWIILIASNSKVFFTSPAMVIRTVGTAGWYMTLISAATAALGFTFIYLLLKRFPGKNIMEIYDSVLGKFMGPAFSLILAATLLLTASVNLREAADVLKIYNYINSPLSFIIFFIISAIVIFSFLGMETIARCSKLFAYLLAPGSILILLFASQHFETRRLFPILGYGLDRTILNGIIRSSAYGEVIIAAIFAKSFHKINDIKKAGYISLIISGLFISATILSIILTFAYNFGEGITAPVYLMATLIDVGYFFQRVESIFLVIWNISLMISLAVLFYMVLIIYCHVFKINDKRPVIIPFAIILFYLALIPKSFLDVVQGYVQYMREYSWIVFYLMPAVALIIAVLRKKKGEVKNA